MNKEEYQEIINTYKKENKELIESGKCKHVFLECLPTKKHGKKYIIYWNNSIGYNVYLIYNKYECFVNIVDVKNRKITIKYNNKEYVFLKSCFGECKIGRMFNIKTSNFRLNVGETIVDEKRNLIIIDNDIRNKNRKNGKVEKVKWYKYRCMKCGNEDWIEESKLLTLKRGCNRCFSGGGYKKIDETNCIATTHPHLMKYLINKKEGYKYSCSSGKYLTLKCPHCGFEKYMRIEHFVSFGFACPKCSDGISYPNKFMANILSELNIDFETEYSPTWCVFYNKFKNKYIRCRYDFYFKHDNNKYIVEMDGWWHREDNNISGQSSEESKEIDWYKDKLAKEHNIEVIRVDCGYDDMLDRFKYVKNSILNSKLSEIFNLDNINWLHIDLKSQKSKLLEVCNHWNEVSKDKKEISKLFNISTSTVNDYLHKGEELGLCKYERGKIIYPKSKMKSIKCITTGEYFKCVNDIDLNKYSIKNKARINSVCNPNSRHRYCGTYNGKKLEWKYISKQEYEDYINKN